MSYTPEDLAELHRLWQNFLCSKRQHDEHGHPLVNKLNDFRDYAVKFLAMGMSAEQAYSLMICYHDQV